jgi:hypothetical protein
MLKTDPPPSIQHLSFAFQCSGKVLGWGVNSIPALRGQFTTGVERGNHRGPDTPDNIIVLCPNHHAEFDYGWMAVDPDTMKICHVDPDNQYAGRRLGQVAGHEIAREYFEYHVEHIFRKRLADHGS